MGKRQLETYTYTFTVDGEEHERRETFIWRLGYRAAFSLAWRVLNRRHGHALNWMEC